MKSTTATGLILSCLIIAACKKAPDAPVVAEPAAVAAPVPAPPPEAKPEPTPEQAERAKKMAALDYATMEDRSINDPRAQWASSAKASSTFGAEKAIDGQSGAHNAVGAVDGKYWRNNQQDIGFDWIEATFDKPVNATEVRVVFEDGAAAMTRLELQDTDGKWNTVWSGLSEVKSDKRGARTWFVRSFDKTAYKVKAVKATLANNVERGYKTVDALQLVGD